MTTAQRIRPKFNPGRVAATPAALEAIGTAGQDPTFFLDMHVQGNWGCICPEDEGLNNQALVDGSRIFSVYQTLLGVKLWIITEAEGDDGTRSATTILLPEEY